VIDTVGFASFEVFEIEGTVGHAQYVFGDELHDRLVGGNRHHATTETLVNSVADTGDGVLAEEATYAITRLMVSFSEQVRDLFGNTDPDDVTNPANYLLINDGAMASRR
jgi:hypothetical protein